MIIRIFILSFLLSFTAHANVAGKYTVSLSNHPLLNSFSVILDSEANVLSSDIVGDYVRDAKISVSYAGLAEYKYDSGFLTITVSWTNDGSLELTKAEVFISNDAHFGKKLVSVLSMYSDGSTSIQSDFQALLSH